MWGRHPWQGHTYQLICACPLDGGLSGTVVKMWNGGITVDGKLVYPVVLYPRCVAVGIFQGSCLERAIDPDEYCFLYDPGDALGLPTPYGETVQLVRMAHGVGMVINVRGDPNMFLVSVPKSPTSTTNVLLCASQMVTLISVDNRHPPL